MLMPELIIVESWREKIASSDALTRLRKPSSISRELLLAAMSRTISPRCLSWSETACLDSASSSPRALTPARSIALNTYVLMPGLLCGHSPARAEPLAAEQAVELLWRRGAAFGELAADEFLADEGRERRVHGLHARRGAGLQHRVDLVRLALP